MAQNAGREKQIVIRSATGTKLDMGESSSSDGDEPDMLKVQK